MTEMTSTIVFATMRIAFQSSWRHRQSQTFCRQIITGCFKGDYRQTKSQAQKTRHRSTEGVANDPNIGIWVECSDVVVKIDGSGIIAGLVFQCLDHTCRVASVGACLTVTDLSPKILATLSTTTAEEEIVVQLVPSSRAISIKYCWRSALEADDDRSVARVGEDVST